MRVLAARWAPALLAILAGAAALRFAGLGHQSFWLDEAYTERIVRRPFGGMLSTIPQTESTPPLYYVLAWAWARIFGFGEVGLRSLSALAGTLVVLVGWAAARRLAGPVAALVAALLLAVHPLLWWFSQEARAYALATLFVALSLWCLAGALQDGDRRWWAGWSAAATAALLTHYFAGFAVAVELAWLWWRGDRRRAAGAAVPLLVAVLALVPLALAQRGTGNAAYIGEGSFGGRLLQVPKQLLIGFASPSQTVTTVLAAALALAALAGLRRRAAARGGRLALALAVVAGVLPVLLAAAGLDYLNGRNLLVLLPALAVAGGAGLVALRPRRLAPAAVGAAAALLLAVTLLIATEERYQRENWRGAARALSPASGGRVIVASPGAAQVPLSVYLPRLRALPPQGAAVQEIDLLAIPRHPTGSGAEPPPRPAAPPPLPPGFAPAGRTLGAWFTVLRFRAPAPVLVQPGQVVGDALEPGPPALLLQP